MSRYAAMFARGPAFVPFLMLGDGGAEATLAHVDALVRGGASALELGIPFSDPIADGPTIQAAAVRALAAGASLDVCFGLLAEIRARHDLPVGLLVYANLVGDPAAGDFYLRAAACGVDSVLVADVPTEEIAPYHHAATAAGVEPVMIAAPNSDDAALDTIARLSRGYVYVVSRTGVTGAETEAGSELDVLLAGLRQRDAAPSLVGFGISRPDHVRAAIAAGAAGAIAGSAIVRIIAEAEGPERLHRLAALVESLAGAAR